MFADGKLFGRPFFVRRPTRKWLLQICCRLKGSLGGPQLTPAGQFALHVRPRACMGLRWMSAASFVLANKSGWDQCDVLIARLLVPNGKTKVSWSIHEYRMCTECVCHCKSTGTRRSSRSEPETGTNAFADAPFEVVSPAFVEPWPENSRTSKGSIGGIASLGSCWMGHVRNMLLSSCRTHLLWKKNAFNAALHVCCL